VALVLTSLRLRSGLYAAYRAAERVAAAIPAHPVSAKTDALMDRALGQFLLAENLWRFRMAPDDCLPRSLALFSYLRRLGLPIVHRIGVTASPMEMHAWTEYRDAPVLQARRMAAYHSLAVIA
jgi:hypothetical protein